MIKNLIFDFGQVMVSFKRKHMVEQFVTDSDDSALLQKIVFDRLYWDRLDAGTIEDEEVLRLVRERIPERLHKSARDIYYNWIYNIPEISGMSDLIREMKERFGVKVYLLSNISKYFAAHTSEIGILSCFDGYVLSSTCGFIKPSARNFLSNPKNAFSSTTARTTLRGRKTMASRVMFLTATYSA